MHSYSTVQINNALHTYFTNRVIFSILTTDLFTVIFVFVKCDLFASTSNSNISANNKINLIILKFY